MGHQKVFDYLIANFDDIIQYDKTLGAIKIACGFDNHNVAKHVASCVEKTHPEMKNKLEKIMKKCCLDTTTFFLTNNMDWIVLI